MKTIKQAMFLIILILFIFIKINSVIASPQNKEIKINIGEHGWPPYLIAKHIGSNKGIMLDVLSIIAKSEGYKVTILRLPSKRGSMMLDKGLIDVRAKAKKWVKDPDKYFWTDAIVNSTDLLIYKKALPLRFSKISDLYNRKIGAHRGYIYPILEKKFNNNSIIRVDANSIEKMLKMLINNRTDAAIVNKYVALYTIKKNQKYKNKFKFSKMKIGEEGYRFMFTSWYKWKPFIDKFNEELKKMKKDGRLKAIIEKYK